jgi:hypothetical protein
MLAGVTTNGGIVSRCTFVFGNGLGRSLNNTYFQLSTGLSHVWNDRESFTQAQKDLIISAVEGLDAEAYPKSEEQLDKLQVAIVAAGFLRSFENDKVQWLNDHSRNLPAAFRKFIHEVACYFHDSEQELPRTFIDPLAQFIRKTSSHVGVLNYDNLLYDGFVKEGVLNGYYDTLNDGFRTAGFNSEFMDRHKVRRQAWYMHLHGSPLYIGNKKLMGGARADLSPTANSHIVLTHVSHKPLIISSSNILSEYWQRLGMALGESNRSILVGYSGYDDHLNELIQNRLGEKRIKIVERGNHETQESRERFWKQRFTKCDVNVTAVDNLLKFTEWQDL